MSNSIDWNLRCIKTKVFTRWQAARAILVRYSIAACWTLNRGRPNATGMPQFRDHRLRSRNQCVCRCDWGRSGFPAGLPLQVMGQCSRCCEPWKLLWALCTASLTAVNTSWPHRHHATVVHGTGAASRAPLLTINTVAAPGLTSLGIWKARRQGKQQEPPPKTSSNTGRGGVWWDGTSNCGIIQRDVSVSQVRCSVPSTAEFA
jgi:hypothetical protein